MTNGKGFLVVSLHTRSMTHFKNDLTMSIYERCYTNHFEGSLMSMRR